MTRMTREQSKALTREKLIASARAVFARDGYGGASVDRIADEAGFSKGAFYSNFESKEQIFLELLETVSQDDMRSLAQALEGVDDPEAIIEAVSGWSNRHQKDLNTPMLMLEISRRANIDENFRKRREKLFHSEWKRIGEMLSPLFAGGHAPAEPLVLGALVMELTYGNGTLLHSRPTPGELIALTLRSLRAQALGKRAAG